MPTIIEGIDNYLRARRDGHNAPELIDRVATHVRNLELQINVAADKGEPVDDKRNTYTDGEYTWFNIRIPKHANAEPKFKDWELCWPLDLHAEGIGSTGWDWRSRRSRWVGFDFDAITGHAKGVGVSNEQLENVKQAAMAWPGAEIRKSTGGAGIHLYTIFDDEGISTENHTVHAALARCILGMMSADCGFDFASHVDCCGGNMWFWHRKMTPKNGGLSLIRPSERTFSAADLPANWRDHIEVITRRRTKVRISGISDDALDPFEALTSSHLIVPLDDIHKQIIDELSHTGYSTIWVPDHHLCQTHTKALEQIAPKYQGIFTTNSPGADPGTPNCFWFPRPCGTIKVYRFSSGVPEADTWTQDGEGWTNCIFNRKPTLITACRAIGGVEDEKGGFVFTSANDAKKAAELVGATIEVDDAFSQRQTTLRTHKDGRLIVELEKTGSDATLRGFVAKPKQFVRIFDTVVEERKKEEPTYDLDNIIRHPVTTDDADAGWVIKRNGVWGREPIGHAKIALQHGGIPKTQADKMLGGAVLQPWKLVNNPFGPEYPGDRQWNWEAAQLAYQPVILGDDETPHHPHWDLVFDHAFHKLTPILKILPWARESKLFVGGDYGRAWTACLFRYPFEPFYFDCVDTAEKRAYYRKRFLACDDRVRHPLEQ